MREIISKIADVDYYIRWYANQHDLGVWPRRQIGGSVEFETISEYVLGDNPRSINWPATARTGGHTILKSTRLTEGKIAVVLVVDTSRSMDFGTIRVTKRRLAAEIAAIMAHAAWRLGDLVGFIAYGSGVEIQWPVRNPKDYRFLIPQKILETRSDGNEGSGLAGALSKLPWKRSLVFLISDFQEPLENIESALRTFVLKHDVVPIVLQDPKEKNLPGRRCITVLKDLETGNRRTIWLGGRKRKAVFQKKAKEREDCLKKLFRHHRMNGLWIDQESDFVREVSRLFLRRRQTR